MNSRNKSVVQWAKIGDYLKSLQSHCWRCGEIYCGRCLDKSATLPGHISQKQSPVCRRCYQSLGKTPSAESPEWKLDIYFPLNRTGWRARSKIIFIVPFFSTKRCYYCLPSHNGRRRDMHRSWFFSTDKQYIYLLKGYCSQKSIYVAGPTSSQVHFRLNNFCAYYAWLNENGLAL